MKAVGYVRVSTERQSLESQRRSITLECERRGWVLDRIEEDELSGSDMRRPGLERALASCRKGKVDVIVVVKLDRLSRSLLDFTSLLEEARAKGFNIVALDLGIDLASPSGELVANVMVAVAQWERRAISDRTKEGLAVKRSQGVKLGRDRLVSDDVRARIHAGYAEGRGPKLIAAELNADKVPTVGGGQCWWPSTVRRVLAQT